jgi:hypothetical protein
MIRRKSIVGKILCRQKTSKFALFVKCKSKAIARCSLALGNQAIALDFGQEFVNMWQEDEKAALIKMGIRSPQLIPLMLTNQRLLDRNNL